MIQQQSSLSQTYEDTQRSQKYQVWSSADKPHSGRALIISRSCNICFFITLEQYSIDMQQLSTNLSSSQNWVMAKSVTHTALCTPQKHSVTVHEYLKYKSLCCVQTSAYSMFLSLSQLEQLSGISRTSLCVSECESTRLCHHTLWSQVEVVHVCWPDQWKLWFHHHREKFSVCLLLETSLTNAEGELCS